MDKQEFKTELNDLMLTHGFERKKKAYYYSNDNTIAVIDVQKSNYDNSYYINFGFFIKELSPDKDYPKESECDIRGRFSFYNGDKEEYSFDYINSTSETLKQSINDGINNIIMPVIKNGIDAYLELFPEAKMALPLRVKEFLNVD